MRHTFLVVTVKRWLKSVYIYGSYRKIKTGVPLFWTTRVGHVSFLTLIIYIWFYVCMFVCVIAYLSIQLFMAASLSQ